MTDFEFEMWQWGESCDGRCGGEWEVEEVVVRMPELANGTKHNSKADVYTVTPIEIVVLNANGK